MSWDQWVSGNSLGRNRWGSHYGSSGLRANAICTTPDCDTGQASILQMDGVFQSLPANLQYSFQSAHDSIMQAYNNTWYTGINWIPFNPSCCTIQDLGTQADALTVAMQTAMGQTPVHPLTPQGMSMSGLIVLGIIGFLLVSAVGNRI